jgi:hypothetical protein
VVVVQVCVLCCGLRRGNVFVSLFVAPPVTTAHALQVSSSYFSVKPVLECLQDMHSVPLAEELVYGEAPRPLGYLKPDVVEQVS